MDRSSELPVVKSPGASRGRISRREAVQRLLGGAGAGLAVPSILASHPIHRHLADASLLAQAETKASTPEWAPQFFNPHQNEALIALAERIVPGSTEAQVSRFIDLLLSVDTQEIQGKFLASLAAFEAEALNRFARPFQELSEKQQDRILTDASAGEPSQPGGTSGESSPPCTVTVQGPSAGGKEHGEPPRPSLREHFENMKGWVAGAYYSSEVGMRELGWTGDVYFESFPGCPHPEGHH